MCVMSSQQFPSYYTTTHINVHVWLQTLNYRWEYNHLWIRSLWWWVELPLILACRIPSTGVIWACYSDDLLPNRAMVIPGCRPGHFLSNGMCLVCPENSNSTLPSSSSCTCKGQSVTMTQSPTTTMESCSSMPTGHVYLYYLVVVLHQHMFILSFPPTISLPCQLEGYRTACCCVWDVSCS